MKRGVGVQLLHAFGSFLFFGVFRVPDRVEATGLVVVIREGIVGSLLEFVQPVFPVLVFCSRVRVEPVILSPSGVPRFDVRRYLLSSSRCHGLVQGFQMLVNLVLGDSRLLFPPPSFDQLG